MTSPAALYSTGAETLLTSWQSRAGLRWADDRRSRIRTLYIRPQLQLPRVCILENTNCETHYTALSSNSIAPHCLWNTDRMMWCVYDRRLCPHPTDLTSHCTGLLSCLRRPFLAIFSYADQVRPMRSTEVQRLSHPKMHSGQFILGLGKCCMASRHGYHSTFSGHHTQQCPQHLMHVGVQPIHDE